MTRIETRTRSVFYSPTANRHFLTLKAAARKEAGALLARKYPTEPQERDGVGIAHPGWHWSADDRLCRVHARLVRRIIRAAKTAPPPPGRAAPKQGET